MKYLFFILLTLVLVQCSPKTTDSLQGTSNIDLFNTSVPTPISFDEKKLTTYLKTLHDNNLWMGGVAIMQDGKMLYMKNYGLLSDDINRQADPGTQYRIGSITKMYTAALIFDLIDQKRISLSTPLSDFYPKVANSKRITIKDLLSHRSGIYNYTNDEDFSFTTNYTNEELEKRIEKYKSDFEPNSKVEYSNSNYLLLGFILEKVSGKSYDQELKDKILSQRKIVRTRYMAEVEPSKNMAYSFTWNAAAKKWEKIDSWDVNSAQAAGMISATVGDVNRFVNDLFHGEIVPIKYVGDMVTTINGVGLGTFQFPYRDKKAFGHTGAIEEYQSITGFFPKEQLSFTLISNGLEMVNNDIAIGVLSIVFGDPFEIPKFSSNTESSVEIKPIKADQFIGYYSNDELKMVITVTEKDGKLYGQATDQSQFLMQQNSDDEFGFKKAGLKMQFQQLNGGKYSSFILKQGGGEFLFERN